MVRLALVVVAAVMAVVALACAEERGQLGKDDFLTSSIDAVFDKVNQFSSGEAKVYDKRLMESEEGSRRSADALDRKLSESVVIRTGTSTPGAQAQGTAQKTAAQASAAQAVATEAVQQ